MMILYMLLRPNEIYINIYKCIKLYLFFHFIPKLRSTYFFFDTVSELWGDCLNITSPTASSFIEQKQICI